jgi:hypothetical protein
MNWDIRNIDTTSNYTMVTCHTLDILLEDNLSCALVILQMDGIKLSTYIHHIYS